MVYRGESVVVNLFQTFPRMSEAFSSFGELLNLQPEANHSGVGQWSLASEFAYSKVQSGLIRE